LSQQRSRALWFNYPTWFTPRQRGAIRYAKAAVGADGLAEGRVVAQLTFGFWVSMPDPGQEDALWVPGLRLAFPHSSGERKPVRPRLGTITTSQRHRASQPDVKRDMAKAEMDLLGAAHWIDPTLADWLADTSSVREILARRPLLPPSVRWAAGGL